MGNAIRPIWIRPSTASLWAGSGGCWPSATFRPPDDGSDETEHTRRGTRLHAAIANLIRPDEFTKPEIDDVEWALACIALGAFEDHVPVANYDWTVEKKVSEQMGTDPRYNTLAGTPDLVGRVKRNWWRDGGALLDGPRLVVADWKFGDHPVDAEGNIQLMAYAALLTHSPYRQAEWYNNWQDEDEILLVIIQPSRERRHEPIVNKATVTFGRIAEEYDRLNKLVGKMLDADEPLSYNPREQNCRWCPGARSLECPMLTKSMRETIARSESRMADGRLPSYLYGEFLAKADLIAHFAKHVREDAKRRLEAGEDVAGLKLVPGRAAPRVWTDEQAATNELLATADEHKADLFTESRLKSVAVLDREFRRTGAVVSRAILERLSESPGHADSAVAFEDDRRPTLGEKRVAEALEHFKTKTANKEKRDGEAKDGR